MVDESDIPHPVDVHTHIVDGHVETVARFGDGSRHIRVEGGGDRLELQKASLLNRVLRRDDPKTAEALRVPRGTNFVDTDRGDDGGFRAPRGR